MIDDLVVYVGQGLGRRGAVSLTEALWSEGFETRQVIEEWPRRIQ